MEPQVLSFRANAIETPRKFRKLPSIESTVRELTFTVAELDKHIAAEEKKTGISDPKHFAYSTLAIASIHRRDNLQRTIENLLRYAAIHDIES